MKKKYLPASLELVAFENTDVIATSNPSSEPDWGDVDTEKGWT